MINEAELKRRIAEAYKVLEANVDKKYLTSNEYQVAEENVRWEMAQEAKSS